jgi:hypothetical protein
MKKYDFKRAQEVIEMEKASGLVSATLGMREDWNYTADEVWSKEDSYSEAFLAREIAGISFSAWATPWMSLTFEDGREKSFPIYTIGEKIHSDKDIEQMKSFVAMSGGCPKE